jgi:hypothetical protein
MSVPSDIILLLNPTNKGQKMKVMTAKNLIQVGLTRFVNGEEITEQLAKDIVFAINNEIQLRDYMIGLPLYETTQKCSEYLDVLAELNDESQNYSLAAINAMYSYEMDKPNRAHNYLTVALHINPDYPFANLLSRAFDAGWEPEQLTQMRNVLHESVLELIEEKADEEITNG